MRSIPPLRLSSPDTGHALVAPPAELVYSVLRDGHNVLPAVAVEVGRDHLDGVWPFRLQPVQGPRAAGLARIAEPGDLPGTPPRMRR